MKQHAVSALLLACTLGTVALGGCAGARRVDPHEDTRSELRSDGALPASLLEASEKFAQHFSNKLATAPKIRDVGGPVTIFIGDIRNTSQSTSTADFEVVVLRLRNALINSGASEKLSFVELRGRMKPLAGREEVVNADGAPANPPAYDAKRTFVMNLDVNEVTRGGTHMYNFNATVSHFGSNQIVLTDDYVIKHKN